MVVILSAEKKTASTRNECLINGGGARGSSMNCVIDIAAAADILSLSLKDNENINNMVRQFFSLLDQVRRVM